MICPKCGQQIDNTAKFCEICGEAVNAPAVPSKTNKAVLSLKIVGASVIVIFLGLPGLALLTEPKLIVLGIVFLAIAACGGYLMYKSIKEYNKLYPSKALQYRPVQPPVYSPPRSAYVPQPVSFIPAAPQEQQQLLDRIDSISTSGIYFEEVTAELLRHNGFTNVHTTPPSSDYGVDVLANKDGKKYAIQCKCYSNAVGNKAVQEVNAGKSVYHCSKAVVLTNNCFSKNAQQLAASCGVELWDRQQLQFFISHTDRATILRLINLNV